MKVTVNNKEEKEIDWDVSQLLITKEGRKVLTTGKHKADSFEGLSIDWYGVTDFGSNWSKNLFTLYKGSITLEND
jgi:hypothetical protein